MKNKIPKRRISYERKKSLIGLAFVSLWLCGFTYFFLIPFGFSFVFSVSKIVIDVGSINFTPIGLRNYITFLTVDPTFYIRLIDVIKDIIWQIPLIVMYSLLLAIVLNSKFAGRMFFRAVFFLPVVILSGTIMSLMSNLSFSGASSDNTTLFRGIEFAALLTQVGVGTRVVDFVMSIINNIFELVWRSGVQILFFLAGLQTIPKNLYEAAQVEGATAWEVFWKITFPIISPTTILCVFYTIVDTANDTSNAMVGYINEFIRQSKFSAGSALSIIWFAIIIFTAGMVFYLTRKNVYFMDDRG